MADQTGRKIRVDISSDNFSGSDEDLSGVKDFTITHGTETIDVTDNDSGNYKEALVGFQSATASITMNYDEADAGQDLLRAANEGGLQYYLRIRPEGDNATSREIIWKFTCTSLTDPAASSDGVEEISADVEFTGTPTIQPQS